MKIVRGGGLTFMTEDPLLTRAVERCAELEAEVEALRRHEVARYRTLRRDVSSIKKTVRTIARHASDEK